MSPARKKRKVDEVQMLDGQGQIFSPCPYFRTILLKFDQLVLSLNMGGRRPLVFVLAVSRQFRLFFISLPLGAYPGRLARFRSLSFGGCFPPLALTAGAF